MIRSFLINANAVNRIAARSALREVMPDSLKAKFLFLWVGDYDGDNLLDSLGSAAVITVTGKDWLTRYIPPDTSATFSVTDNADFLAADGTDDFWFDAADSLESKIHADLIISETERTFIKYSDFEPYNVYAIGILKDGEVLTETEKNIVSKFFKLWIFYFGTFSDYGYLKDNRTIT